MSLTLVEFNREAKLLSEGRSVWTWNSICLYRSRLIGSLLCDFYVVYNPVYSVPVLYFQAFSENGSLLSLSALQSLYAGQAIELGENPATNTPMPHISPCRTADIMLELPNAPNYITAWLSVYGQAFGL